MPDPDIPEEPCCKPDDPDEPDEPDEPVLVLPVLPVLVLPVLPEVPVVAVVGRGLVGGGRGGGIGEDPHGGNEPEGCALGLGELLGTIEPEGITEPVNEPLG